MPGGNWSVPDFIAALTRGMLGVKLGPGVLGTIVPINIVGLIAIAVLGYSLSGNPQIAIAALAIGVGFLIYANERAFRYAEKNPIPALLGGGELLQLFRDQMSAKDKTIITESLPSIAAGKMTGIDEQSHE